MPKKIPPSQTSVVHLPPLPSIPAPAPPPARGRNATAAAVAAPRKSRSPARPSGAVGGRLNAAREQLSRRGVDPLTASISAATTLQEEDVTVQRRSRGRPKKVVEEKYDVEQDVAGPEEQKGELPASPARRRPGRPRKSDRPAPALFGAQEGKEDEDVEKPTRPMPRRRATSRNYVEQIEIDVDDDEEKKQPRPAVNGHAEEDADLTEEDEKAATPTKRGPGRPRKVPGSAATTPASTDKLSSPSLRKRKARVSSPSPPPSEPKRPRQESRGRPGQRKPWASEEERWLKKGVIRFNGQHRKWAQILKAYGDHFQGRSVVDLKDKWRNMQIKVGKYKRTGRGKQKGRGKDDDADDDGEVEEEEEEEDEDEVEEIEAASDGEEKEERKEDDGDEKEVSATK